MHSILFRKLLGIFQHIMVICFALWFYYHMLKTSLITLILMANVNPRMFWASRGLVITAGVNVVGFVSRWKLRKKACVAGDDFKILEEIIMVTFVCVCVCICVFPLWYVINASKLSKKFWNSCERLFHVVSHILKWRGNPNSIVNFLLVAYLEFLYAWFFHQVCFRGTQWVSFLKSQMVLFFQFCLKKHGLFYFIKWNDPSNPWLLRRLLNVHIAS